MTWSDLAAFAPLVAILILLAMSGFFSGSETALTAVSRARMHALEKDGEGAARRVNALIARRERLIGGILLGNNLVNNTAAVIAAVAFTNLFGDVGAVYATVVMTALILIFAEVLPKTYAISNPDRMAMAVSGPIGLIVTLLAPIVSAVQAVVRATLGLLGVKAQGDVLSPHDEIRGAIDLHHSEGAVHKRDRDMLGGILDLGDLAVEDVMIHRKSMETLDADAPSEAAVRQALGSRYTRLPVYQGDADNIIGVVHAKDLSRALADARGDASQIAIADIAREPWFVPETTPLMEQLGAFRSKREHFALVVDEYGALMGLVTLEDILEEIVGEIDDEFDRPIEGVRQEGAGYLVDGGVTIRDLNRALDWDLPDDEAVTVAGLVIHEAKAIPERGQIFSFFDRRFEIVDRKRNQITKLRITPPPEPAAKTTEAEAAR